VHEDCVARCPQRATGGGHCLEYERIGNALGVMHGSATQWS
jgi:hypothetical protein